MRRDHDILMKGTDPEGGKWNFDPKESIGKNARPFTTLYWDFLSRNHNRLKKNPRMGLQFRNLDRKSDTDRNKIRKKADRLKSDFTRKNNL